MMKPFRFGSSCGGSSTPASPVHGGTGYAFLNHLNGLFVDGANAAALTAVYQSWTKDTTPLRDLVYQKKYLILRVSLSS